MKYKFRITLKENDELLFNTSFINNIKSKMYKITTNNELITFSFSKKFIFIKENDDNIIEIKYDNGIISSKLFLKIINDYIDLPVVLEDFKKDDDKLLLKYSIEGEIKTLEISREKLNEK